MTTKQQLIADAGQRASDHRRLRLAAQQIVDQWVREGRVERLPDGRVRFTEDEAERIAMAEAAAWEAQHLGPGGDYVDLGGGRCIERVKYDPEKHGPEVQR